MKGEMRLRRLVKNTTYKPDSRITLRRVEDRISLGFHIWAEDTVNRGTYRWIDNYWSVNTIYMETHTDSEIYADFMWSFAQLELHEVCEWFCIEGKQALNPHPIEPLLGEYPREVGRLFKETTIELLAGVVR